MATTDKLPLEATDIQQYGSELMFSVEGAPDRLSVSTHSVKRNWLQPLAVYEDKEGRPCYWPISHEVMYQLRAFCTVSV